MTQTAELFKNGRSQAVRLPAEFRFEGQEVFIRRDPTLPHDLAEDLVDARERPALLEEAFASGDAKFITVALGAVARARGMSAVAEQPLARMAIRNCQRC